MSRHPGAIRKVQAISPLPQGALLISRPDAAEEGAGDVLAVDLSEDGYERIAGGGQAELIADEKPAREVRNDSLHIERPVCEANLAVQQAASVAAYFMLHSPEITDTVSEK